MNELLGNLRLLFLMMGCMSYIYMVLEIDNEVIIDIHYLVFCMVVLLNILKAYTRLFDRFTPKLTFGIIPSLIHMYLLDFSLGFLCTFVMVLLLLLL